MPITGKIVLVEINTTDSGQEIRLYRVIITKGKVLLVEKEYSGVKSLEKWKHSLAFLFVTGTRVVTKPYAREDLSIKRILENKELHCDITPASEEGRQNLSFVRKEVPRELLELLKKNRISLLKLFVGRRENPAVEERIKLFWEREMSPGVIRKSPERLNMLCNALYHRIQLPVLITFLLLLLGNYFVNSHLRQENETMSARINMRQKSSKTRQKEEEKLGRLIKLYQQAPDCSLAAVADRIASYVPQNLTLTTLSIFPLVSGLNHSNRRKKDVELVNKVVIIKGWSDIPGSITLFSQFLGKDDMFGKVEVISLSRRKEENLFDFELQLTLSKK